ncbi:MAG: DUF5723 family protein [Bacteroidota bacterium]
MNGHRISALLSFALCAVLTATIARAGSERTNIRGMGMARTFVASARGLDAVGINPANLGYPDVGTVTLSLLPFGVHIGTDMMTYGIYRDFFTGVATDSGRVGRTLSESDKQTIIDGFQDGVGRGAGDAELRPLGISVDLGAQGRFALSLTEQVAAQARVPKEFVQFFLFGNAPGSVYDFGETRVGAQWTREYALSYGRRVPTPPFLRSLAAGVAVKYVQGYAYFAMEHSGTSLVTGTDGVLQGRINMMTRSSGFHRLQNGEDTGVETLFDPVGTGWGIDLGVAGEVNEYLSFGIAVTDIGSVEWDKDLEIFKTDSSFTIDNPFSEAQRNAIEDAVKGKKMPGEPFSSSLPTKLRVGVAVDLSRAPFFKTYLWSPLLVELDYNQGFDNIPGATTRARFSLGVEYSPLSWLPLRTGIAFGGEDRSNFAFGLGFHASFLDFDLASENLNWIFDQDNFSYASVAMGLKFRF